MERRGGEGVGKEGQNQRASVRKFSCTWPALSCPWYGTGRSVFPAPVIGGCGRVWSGDKLQETTADRHVDSGIHILAGAGLCRLAKCRVSETNKHMEKRRLQSTRRICLPPPSFVLSCGAGAGLCCSFVVRFMFLFITFDLSRALCVTRPALPGRCLYGRDCTEVFAPYSDPDGDTGGRGNLVETIKVRNKPHCR